jgi:hypothetical protein
MKGQLNGMRSSELEQERCIIVCLPRSTPIQRRSFPTSPCHPTAFARFSLRRFFEQQAAAVAEANSCFLRQSCNDHGGRDMRHRNSRRSLEIIGCSYSRIGVLAASWDIRCCQPKPMSYAEPSYDVFGGARNAGRRECKEYALLIDNYRPREGTGSRGHTN